MRSQTVNSEMIGKYLNRYGYSDINPVGKIVGVKGKQDLLIQPVESCEQKTKLEFVPGGFSSICINQHAQAWDITLSEGEDKQRVVRLTKATAKSLRVEDEPVKFYDYNF